MKNSLEKKKTHFLKVNTFKIFNFKNFSFFMSMIIAEFWVFFNKDFLVAISVVL